jgi:hypothetical protein
MTGDRATTDRESGKARPAGAPPGKPSIANLSRQLGEWLTRQWAADAGAAAAARRAALEAYDLARERRLIAGLSVVLAPIVGAAVAYFVSTIDPRPVPPLASAAASPQPAPSHEIAIAPPAPVPPDAPSPAITVADAAAVEPLATPAPYATNSQPAPVETTPSAPPLQRDEVSEIQARLRFFGFNPGPVDGTVGRKTEVAVRRYQQVRGQPQTGEIDGQLLEQLRQDPSPPVVQKSAQRGARPDARATGSPGPRRADLFEPVRAAGDRVGRWLGSLTR